MKVAHNNKIFPFTANVPILFYANTCCRKIRIRIEWPFKKFSNYPKRNISLEWLCTQNIKLLLFEKTIKEMCRAVYFRSTHHLVIIEKKCFLLLLLHGKNILEKHKSISGRKWIFFVFVSTQYTESCILKVSCNNNSKPKSMA